MRMVVRRRRHDDGYVLSVRLVVSDAEAALMAPRDIKMEARTEDGETLAILTIDRWIEGVDFPPAAADQMLRVETGLLHMFQQLARTLGITPSAAGVEAWYELGEL